MVAWIVAYPVYVGTAYIGLKYFSDEGKEFAEEAAKAAIEAGTPVIQGAAQYLSEAASALGGLSLDFVKGLGGAIVDGVDSAFDAVRKKFIEGKEPDIVAGFTIGMLTLLTGVYIWNSARNTANVL